MFYKRKGLSRRVIDEDKSASVNHRAYVDDGNDYDGKTLSGTNDMGSDQLGRKGFWMFQKNMTVAVAAMLALGAPLAAASAAAPVSATKAEAASAKDAKPNRSTAEEMSGTALLNKQQQEKSAQENAAYQARVAAAEQSEASSQAEYQARTQAYEAEKERVAAEAAQKRLQWEADVRACEAGQKERCAQPIDSSTAE
ncbi:hypothetical protein [Sphingopyxis yananensis]|uniref:hypothetical protein n=1 Tax=Sphingopyxis yananensis TaxID=2886687 RepID=UPI001D102E2F|nr:hypothetical protein [Sphingopyxis yananensis]MCC2602325.1 hypothetical protein [Sphingopyxis yananensis]